MADGRSSGAGAGENRLKNVGKFAAGVLTSAKSCGNITKAPETARVCCVLILGQKPKIFGKTLKNLLTWLYGCVKIIKPSAEGFASLRA